MPSERPADWVPIHGVIGREGVQTDGDDGRLIEAGALSWREPPIPLLSAREGGMSCIGEMYPERASDGSITVRGHGRLTERHAVGFDLDSMEADWDEETEVLTITKARVMGATLQETAVWPDVFVEPEPLPPLSDDAVAESRRIAVGDYGDDLDSFEAETADGA